MRVLIVVGKLLITGDCHGTIDRNKLKKIRHNKKLCKDDVLIIAGDWGGIWDVNKSGKSELLELKWYDRFPCTVLVVDGNHDNHIRLNKLPEITKFENIVGIISNNIYHLKRGNIYIINNKKFFIFGGAESIDKKYRIEGISWWKEEIYSQAQLDNAFENLDKYNWQVDYVVTHTAPPRFIHAIGKFDAYYKDPTVALLKEIESKLIYDFWFFGHFHVDVYNKYQKFFALYNTVIENIEEYLK